MDAVNFRRKAAVCRRLARLAEQPDIARALLELAEDFEQAAFDSEVAEAEARLRRAATPKKRG